MSANQQQLSDEQSPFFSGDVHLRDNEDGARFLPPESRRSRILRQDGEGGTWEAAYNNHPQMLCFAARNRRGRFYIASTTNNFGGVPVTHHVLLDAGCSSRLLPFPLNSSFPQVFSVQARYKWTVPCSRGTGAIQSPAFLEISTHLGSGFRPCTLAGKEQPRLPLLRFLLGSDAARQLLDRQRYLRNMLDENCIRRLNDFLQQIGGPSLPGAHLCLAGPVLSIRSEVLLEG